MPTWSIPQRHAFASNSSISSWSKDPACSPLFVISISAAVTPAACSAGSGPASDRAAIRERGSRFILPTASGDANTNAVLASLPLPMIVDSWYDGAMRTALADVLEDSSDLDIQGEDLRQRALLRYNEGMLRAAAEDLDEYVKIAPEASDAEEMRQTALSIRRTIAMMN